MNAKQRRMRSHRQRPMLLEGVAPGLLLTLLCVLLVGTASASAAPNGASLVKDINDEELFNNGRYGEFTEYGGELLFRALGSQNGDESGIELWKSDGTEEGTALLKDIAVGSPFVSSIPTHLTVSGDTLFFQANTGPKVTGSELYKSDGTEEGTVMVKDINTLPSGEGGNRGGIPLRLADANGTLFFLADDGGEGADTVDRDLWKSDGTEDGTTKVHEFPADVRNQVHGDLFPIGDKIYFGYDNGTTGWELWVSDEAGTRLVKDINTVSDGGAGTEGSTPFQFFDFNGLLLFAADDGNNGFELWKSDGTPDGTVLVENIRTQGEPGTPADSLPREFTLLPNNPGTADDEVLFTAATGNGFRELYTTDGSDASMVQDLTFDRAGSPSFLAEFEGEIYFQALDGSPDTTPGRHGLELWKSDGTDARTVLVKDINTVSGTREWSDPKNLAVADGLLYFSADDGIHGSELWATDGSEEGTVLVEDIYGGTDESGDPNAGAPGGLTEAGDLLFFGASDGTHGSELWRAPKETDPPQTTIESGTANGEIVTTGSATFTFSSDEAESTFNCQLDEGAPVSCDEGSIAYAGLENGPHTFSVAATDRAGNSDPVPETRTFTVAVPADPDGGGDDTGGGGDAGGGTGGDNGPGDTDPGTPTGPTDPGPTDPGDPPADTSVIDLDVTAKKSQKQKGKKIKVKISVSAQENISAKGSGKVKVKKPKKAKYKLKPQTKEVEGGERTILKLKPKSKKDAKKIRQAIKKWKKASRKRKQKLAVKAPVKVVATDDAGNTQKEKRVVTLK